MDSERIILGSGKLYCMVFTGEIPEDTAIETDTNQLAHIKGGASLEYTAETYTAKDDLGVVQKTVLTSEDVTLKAGLLTWCAKTLLAQKQKILKEAIGSTKEKLDTLKEAEKQVQEQFENGEVSEEQYRALQREIASTEIKLGDLEQQAQESNKELEGVADAADDTAEKVSNRCSRGSIKQRKAVCEWVTGKYQQRNSRRK